MITSLLQIDRSPPNRLAAEFPPDRIASPLAGKTLPVVHIIDDDVAMRGLLASFLDSPTLETRSYASAEQFISQYTPAHPECLISDLRMPGLSGMDLLLWLRTSALKLPVILITSFGDIPIAVEAMRRGAIGFLEKPVAETVLLEQVRKALARDSADAAADEQMQSARNRLATVSARERTLLHMLVEGKPSKQIARELGIAIKTVSNHRAHLLKKLNASNTADLVRMAMQCGEDEKMAGV